MPELPEVEVTMRGIAPHLLHGQIKEVILGTKNLRLPLSPDLLNLDGAKVLKLQRRAKYILVFTDKGTLVLHLGMSGHLRVLPQKESLGKHDHFALVMDSGKELILNDIRRFGLAVYVKVDDNPLLLPFLKDLGPEPFSLEFNANYLFEKIKKRRLPIKQLLMDNKVVVGVGNIYASEVLFATSISPLRKGCEITHSECEALVSAIVAILKASIEKGGTTIRDFSGADGKPGYFVQNLHVYGHKGEPCPRCGTAIEEVTLGQRSSFYCPNCQK